MGTRRYNFQTPYTDPERQCARVHSVSDRQTSRIRTKSGLMLLLLPVLTASEIEMVAGAQFAETRHHYADATTGAYFTNGPISAASIASTHLNP